VKSEDADLQSAMLAPPARRARNRRLKRKQREREKLGLHRVELWLSRRALEGLVSQLVHDGQLTDAQALDHKKLECAIAQGLEQQGRTWPT
jgi:hypothetical protein